MSSERAQRYIGQIFFDGSSTLLGVGDQSGQGGYRGRLDRHYSHYTSRSSRLAARPACPFVAVYGAGVPDRMVEHYAFTLSDDLDLLHKKGLTGFGSRAVAVLTMGSSLVGLLAKYDNDKSLAMQDYAAAMDTAQRACETRGVSAIGVGLPLPDENFITVDARKPSRELRQETIEFSRDHLEGWQVPHRFLSIEGVTNPATDRAPDGAHLNAAGYYKVAQALVKCIDPLLGIDSSVEHHPFYPLGSLERIDVQV